MRCAPLLLSVVLAGCTLPRKSTVESSLTEHELINRARAHALQSDDCKAFLKDISSRFTVDTNRPLSQAEVHVPTRTVSFIHNLIPQDGPMFVITVRMKEDGGLLGVDLQTHSPNTIPMSTPVKKE